MEFAEKHLRERGWRRGKGLGRRENGIVEAVKVKMKCDKAGVGHQSGEQFTFHWWDHVFNQAAANISVETREDGVEVKRVTEEASVSVTDRKPRKARLGKDLLYGRFVKADTLTPGSEVTLVKPVSPGDTDSDDDDDDNLDLSSTRRLTDEELVRVCRGRTGHKLTDEELVRVCRGRTGHKGARHGVSMSAKLVRLAEQERQFLAGCGQKQGVEVPSAGEGAEARHGRAKRRKRRKRREQASPEPEHRTVTGEGGRGESSGGTPPEGTPGCTAEGESGHTRRRKEKRKRRSRGEQSPLD